MPELPESDDSNPPKDLVSDSRRLFLLGPQPSFTTLKASIRKLNCKDPVAVVTTGWQEEESADEALMSVLPAGSTNLGLFQRSEQLFENDSELIRQLQVRQDELRGLRDAYRLRLDHCLAVIRDLIDLESRDSFDFQPEIELAFDALRQLDRQYFIRTTQVCDHYDTELDILNRPLIKQQREQLQQILDDCKALVISGGHVAIILNRLRLFGVLGMCTIPIVAWSGGAMALADQIVLFHDHPPQGKGNPEVLRSGMGLFHGILPLPNARHRLILDPARVSLFARRFETYACIGLSEKTILERNDGHWIHTQCARMKLDGKMEVMVS